MLTDLADVYVTILAGGSGTRLWPLSRKSHPKQLLALLSERSLLQLTVDRVLPLVPPDRIYILTGRHNAHAIAQQIPELPESNIFVEPSPRGTAPCLGLAALKLGQKASPSSVMISLHADHAIADEQAFRETLMAAVVSARRGHLVTVGIVPSRPETGYGYIERGSLLDETHGRQVFEVARFTEKPPLSKARDFVATGRYYWNAGYFVWTLDSILAEFRRLLPEVHALLQSAATLEGAAGESAWNAIPPTTIDVGIMERANRVAVVAGEMGWSDIGSWATIHALSNPGEDGNATLGACTHVSLGSANSLICSEKRLVATIGLDGIVLVETEDAILLLPMDRAQDVGKLVAELRSRGLTEFL